MLVILSALLAFFQARHNMSEGGVIIMFEGLAQYGKPTTDRVKKRYAKILEATPSIDSQRAVLFTEYLRDHWDEPLYLRSAGAYKHVLSHLTPVIWDDELIVGSTSRFIKGAQVYPEFAGHIFDSIKDSLLKEGHDFNKRAQPKVGNAKLPCTLSPDELNKLRTVSTFWQDKNWCSLCAKHLHDTLRIFDRSEKWQPWFDSPFFPSYAPKGWIVITYKRILEEGLDSIIEHLQECIGMIKVSDNQDGLEKVYYYKGLILSLQGIISFAENYANEAQRLADQCAEEHRAKELYEISRICRKVPRKAPQTFREALQAFWFIHISLCLELNGQGISPGRFDQYMNPFFENDLLSGNLSPDKALEFLELFRIKCEQIMMVQPANHEAFVVTPMYQHITLAGSDKNGNPADTMLSKFILQARIHIPTQQPVLAVRWRDDLSDFFKLKVIDCIKTAGWCPDIYHDISGTKRFAKQANKQVQDFQNWVVYRDCSLNNGKLSAVIDALFETHHTLIFDLLVNDGLFLPVENSLHEGSMRRKCFQNLVREYTDIIHRVMQKKQPKLEDVLLSYNNIGLVHPFLSPLQNNLFTGTDTYRKLPNYNSDDLIVAYGMIDLAKTLTVIKKYVFDEAIFTVSEIRDAIQSDFEGTETMRKKLLLASSQSKRSAYFEDTLLELFDTWFRLSDKPARTGKKTISKRRFTLVKGTSQRTQGQHPM